MAPRTRMRSFQAHPIVPAQPDPDPAVGDDQRKLQPECGDPGSSCVGGVLEHADAQTDRDTLSNAQQTRNLHVLLIPHADLQRSRVPFLLPTIRHQGLCAQPPVASLLLLFRFPRPEPIWFCPQMLRKSPGN